MKIEDKKLLPDQIVGSAEERIRPKGSKAPDRAAPGAGDQDQVSVSGTARELVQLAGDIGALDGIRSDKVAALKSAIDDGSYVVDTRQVARSFLREVVGELVG
jgi:flagellar biosynthesis anti-sigma factor FlgM